MLGSASVKPRPLCRLGADRGRRGGGSSSLQCILTAYEMEPLPAPKETAAHSSDLEPLTLLRSLTFSPIAVRPFDAFNSNGSS